MRSEWYEINKVLPEAQEAEVLLILQPHFLISPRLLSIRSCQLFFDFEKEGASANNQKPYPS